jgi:hypothetical protein
MLRWNHTEFKQGKRIGQPCDRKRKERLTSPTDYAKKTKKFGTHNNISLVSCVIPHHHVHFMKVADPCTRRRGQERRETSPRHRVECRFCKNSSGVKEKGTFSLYFFA